MRKERKNQEEPSEGEKKQETTLSQALIYEDLPGEFLEWIDSNSNDLITICNQDGEILFVSQSIKNTLGYSPKEVIGKNVTNFIPPYDRKAVCAGLVKEENKKQKVRLHIKDINEKLIWMESDISLLKKHSDQENLFISTTRDITYKKEMEEMMVRSEKMSIAGQLAAGIAHEIRNPLTSLKGFLQLLQAGIENKEDYYHIMEEEIQKIEEITTELLFISKPMTDGRGIETISRLLKDVLILIHSEAKLAGIEIALDIKKDAKIFCDRSQIKQVFINLLKNAVESMNEGGLIRVVVTEDAEEQMCMIDVKDEGPGIPEDIIHKLIEPFFTTKKTGTGLGLMITNEIIERHGGRLSFFNNEGEGSTFRIFLPLEITTTES